MKLELYYRTNCGFSVSVLNTVTNLNITDKIEHKDILETESFKDELVKLCGDTQVPTLVIDGKPMRESEDIKKYLVGQFM